MSSAPCLAPPMLRMHNWTARPTAALARFPAPRAPASLLNLELLHHRTVDDHHRAGGIQPGQDGVEAETAVGHGPHGSRDDRQMPGKATSEDTVGCDRLQRRLPESRGQRGDHVLSTVQPLAEHGIDPGIRREHDGQAVGPSERVTMFDESGVFVFGRRPDGRSTTRGVQTADVFDSSARSLLSVRGTGVAGLIRAGQPERMPGDVVEDHL